MMLPRHTPHVTFILSNCHMRFISFFHKLLLLMVSLVVVEATDIRRGLVKFGRPDHIHLRRSLFCRLLLLLLLWWPHESRDVASWGLGLLLGRRGAIEGVDELGRVCCALRVRDKALEGARRLVMIAIHIQHRLGWTQGRMIQSLLLSIS